MVIAELHAFVAHHVGFEPKHAATAGRSRHRLPQLPWHQTPTTTPHWVRTGT
jgi:hypothetical protein